MPIITGKPSNTTRLIHAGRRVLSLTGRWKECWNLRRVLLPATRRVDVDRLLRFANELRVEALLYGLPEGYRSADLLKNAAATALVSLKWPEKAKDSDPEEPDSIRVLEVRDHAPSTPAVLARSGVRFALYSGGIDRRADLFKAVKRAIDAGLTPEDALKAMTLTPAEIYGVADRLGSIEKGKIANLVVTKGDLFVDETEVKYVFVDGVKFEPVEEPPPARPGAARGFESWRNSMKIALLALVWRRHSCLLGRDSSRPRFSTGRHRNFDQLTKAMATAGVFAATLAAATPPIVIQNATILTVTKGTLTGSVLIRDGKIADVGEKIVVPAGRQSDRCFGSIRDARHHRLPLAHRRRQHQRGQRFGFLHGGHQRRIESG